MSRLDDLDFLERAEKRLKSNKGSKSAVDSVVIPVEVLDLVRFMCSTWAAVDKWACKNMTGVALMKYPVIQDTSNQMKLKRIGEQPHDTASIAKAVEWMLKV